MKKIISFVLMAAMLLSSVSCFALEATVHSTQHNVYIEGKVDALVEDAILTLNMMKDGEVFYINEYKNVNLDGTYTIKFKSEADLDGATINVKYADQDVTNSVVKATATSAIMEADVFVTDENDKSFALTVDKTPNTIVAPEKVVNGVTLPERTYVSDYANKTADRSGLKAVVNIKNKFAYEDSVSVLVAAYDENNKLLACEMKDVAVEYGYEGENQVVETAVIDVPEGTKSAKAFCWNSITSLVPYGKEADGELPEVDLFCIGDSFCQTYGRGYYPESGWGGHIGDYFIDKVRVTNYGTSGAWAQSALNNPLDPKYGTSSFHGGWQGNANKPNEGDWQQMLNDPNFSEGDYVIVSLGLNDASKYGPDNMEPVDWYELGLEEMIRSAKEHKVNLVICSPLLRANMVQPATTQVMVDRAQQVANEYGIPYLPVCDAQAKQYSEEFGYDVNKTYSAEEAAVFVGKIYAKYYLDRDAFRDPNHEFHLSEEELANHSQKDLHPDGSGRNSHPNLRGADNMARWMAELLKDTDSDLRFYVK